MIDRPVESGPAPALLNERAVRAAAGILFLFAIVAFMNAWLLGNFAPTRVFVVAFLVDFALRWAALGPPDTLDGNMCSGGSDGNEKEVHGRVQA